MKTYLRRERQKLGILSLAAAVLLVAGINCSKLNRLDLNIGGINWSQNDTIEFGHILKKEFDCGGLNGGGLYSLPKQNLVIKNNTEWRTLLNSMDSVDRDYSLVIYSFDSSTHQLLAVFDEVRNDAIWGIEIANIVEQACHIVVTYHTWKKRTGYGTQAFHIVRMPASNKPVVFQEEFDNEAENVPYVSCPLVSNDTFFLRGTAYLFKDSMPAGQNSKNYVMNILHYTTQDSTSFSASYNSSGVSLFLYYPHNLGVGSYGGVICNLPNFAKQWNIPPEGKELYYRGYLLYTLLGVGFDINGHFILTHLEEK